MEAESSPFESSEMLATFLASTPFLEESWRLCSLANSAAPRSFVADLRGEVGYLAFSGVQVIDGPEPSCGTLVALDKCGWDHLFLPLRCNDEGEGAVKVDAGFLRLFLEFYHRQDFRNQIQEFLGKVKMIILTGHSFGATTASLTTLWLLSHLQPMASPISVLCLTFGTPLLGNKSLSRAILQERWGGSFCNIVSKLDVVPRLFFAPLTSLTPQLHLLLQFWQVAMASPSPEQLVGELQKQNFDEFFSNVKKCVKDAAQSEEGVRNNLFWPLGSYLFYSEEGAICLDNATSIVKMMHLMLETVSPASTFEDNLKCFEDHLKYNYCMKLLSSQFRRRINIGISESSEEAGVLALQPSRIDPQNQVKQISEDIQSPPTAVKEGQRETANRSPPVSNKAGKGEGKGDIQSPMPSMEADKLEKSQLPITSEIREAEHVMNIPKNPENQAKQISKDIQSPPPAIEAGIREITNQSPPMPSKAGEGDIQSPMHLMEADEDKKSQLPISSKIQREEHVIYIPNEPENQIKQISDDIQSPPPTIEASKPETTNQSPPMPNMAGKGEGEGEGKGKEDIQSQILPNDPKKSTVEAKTVAKAPIPEEKKITNQMEMSRLALNGASLGSATTAYFGVNRHKILDLLGLIYIICFTLAVVLLISGGHSHRRTISWGNHFTCMTIVMTIVVVIAAAVLGERR